MVKACKMEKVSWPYRVLYAYARWAYVYCYCRLFEVRGAQHIPRRGPVIFVTNHQNNLPDALSFLFATPRKPVFVARADFFNTPLSNRLLRFLRILPMYRADHGRDSLKKELPATMRELSQHLSSNGAIAVMAEGSSAPSRSIRPLKKSWARLAVAHQAAKDEVHVVPAVIEYSDWQNWGPDVRITFGERITLNAKDELTDNQKVKQLTDLAQHRLSEMVSGDDEMALWHLANTQNRIHRIAFWKILGLFILPLGYLLLAPLLLFTHRRVKAHSRVDFKSTLQIGFIILGTPFWLILILPFIYLVNPWLPLLLLFLFPLLLWMFARCVIARRTP